MHFSADYVERMSPQEREIYKNFYIEEQKKKAKKPDFNPTIGSPIDIVGIDPASE